VQVLKSQSDFGQMRHFHPRDCRFQVQQASGNLPHVTQHSVTYFVTFRTADALLQENLGGVSRGGIAGRHCDFAAKRSI
jgi:hypothetical protein